MVLKQFSAMVKARTMEFVRDRATLMWGIFFPIILVVGFSFAFSGAPQPIFKLGISGNTSGLQLTELNQIQFVEYVSGATTSNGTTTNGAATSTSSSAAETAAGPSATDTALGKLRRHELDGYLDMAAGTYYLNAENPKSELLRRLFAADPLLSQFSEAAVNGQAIRYIDFLVPGVIGMNIMFSCLFGVGFVIVRYRKNGVLKRLKATPVSALNFVTAQTVSRLVIVMIMSAVIYIGTDLVFNFRMEGSYLNLLLITVLATMCMISLGLLMAARMKSEEAAGGLVNLIAFPMMILSGVFFSMEGAHEVVQGISQALPLTHFVSGAREIMLEGAGLGQILPHVALLGGLTIVFTGLAAALFKWE